MANNQCDDELQLLMQSALGTIESIEKCLTRIHSESPIEHAADAASEMHYLKSRVAFLYDRSCSLLSDRMGDLPEITISSGTKIEKKQAADRKSWDHKRLADHVASRINDMAVDMDTGEVVMSPQQMISKVFDYAAVSYWRVKELSKIGVNADMFCEVSEPKTSIIIRKGKNNE